MKLPQRFEGIPEVFQDGQTEDDIQACGVNAIERRRQDTFNDAHTRVRFEVGSDGHVEQERAGHLVQQRAGDRRVISTPKIPDPLAAKRWNLPSYLCRGEPDTAAVDQGGPVFLTVSTVARAFVLHHDWARFKCVAAA
jgi:hypothetical protein